MANRVAQRRVARAEGRRRNLPSPRERRPGRLRDRAHEGAAPDVPAQQPARFELAVGTDDGGAADVEALRELALWRQTRPRGQLAARDRRLDEAHEMSV